MTIIKIKYYNEDLFYEEVISSFPYIIKYIDNLDEELVSFTLSEYSYSTIYNTIKCS